MDKKNIFNVATLAFIVVQSCYCIISMTNVFDNLKTGNQNLFSQHPAYHLTEQYATDKKNATDSKPGSTSIPETSIIILSSLIPTHPSIKMLNDTFNSISMLDGIDPRTPIYISVDGLPAHKLNQENIHTLHEYVKSLRIRFQDDPRVTIVNNYEHGHVSNSIGVVLELVKTEFIYMLQHDLKFTKRIDHTALVKSMREQPKKIQIVRFGKDRRPGMIISKDCKEHEIVKSNGLNFTLGRWSDHNHFTTRAYYERLLADLGPVGRFPEGPMEYQARHRKPPRNCTYIHQYLYNIQEGPFIKHMDGQHSTS